MRENYYILLQIVDIDHNPIKYIDPRAFEGLPQLKALLIYSHEIKEALKLTSGRSSLITLKLNKVGQDFVNMDFKYSIVLETLHMTRGELANIPINIQYIAGTLRSLSLEHNHIATK